MFFTVLQLMMMKLMMLIDGDANKEDVRWWVISVDDH